MAKVLLIVSAILAAFASITSTSYGKSLGETQYEQSAIDNNPLTETTQETDDQQDYYEPPKYEYSYGVQDTNTGDFKTHKEERDGEVVRGEYTVAEPDGTIRTVKYTVDKVNGYQAVISTRQAENVHNNEAAEIKQTSTAKHQYSLEANHQQKYLQNNPNFIKARADYTDNNNEESTKNNYQTYTMQGDNRMFSKFHQQRKERKPFLIRV